MEKIPTLFLRNPENMKLVTREVNPEAAWVLTGGGIPTRKMDGTNVRITIQNERCIKVEKRRNPTREEKANGAEPGYVDAHRDDPADQYIFMAVDQTDYVAGEWIDGIWPCEALGPKIQGNAEHLDSYTLYPFTMYMDLLDEDPRTYEEIRDFLARTEIEGIVWHDLTNGRMAKIKRRDFGLAWPIKQK